jgi:hypothetical protein
MLHCHRRVFSEDYESPDPDDAAGVRRSLAR